LWAAGLLFPEHQGFEGMVAVSASVFKYWH
jgi:hypothetical protein